MIICVYEKLFLFFLFADEVVAFAGEDFVFPVFAVEGAVAEFDFL